MNQAGTTKILIICTERLSITTWNSREEEFSAAEFGGIICGNFVVFPTGSK